ncbi:heat shock protein 70 A1 [Biomphalaria pfeifferi]|uniref:Heat shock protein 70 A1 n=1 Tax=Biomphalaria pfeifferi TaxID=112525 RepID=A0AAD8BJJ4_BIOPF|nr:heat shock protein 70 A1 [Biomphalaria pfeifferi]
MDSEDFTKNLLSEINQLWMDRELCDVNLSVEGVVIPAHRVILAALSPYFKAMFCSQLDESHKFQIRIQDLSLTAVQAIINFAYTAHLELTEDTVQTIMQTAAMMQISAVEKLCCSFLVEHLHPSNCLGIRDFAHIIGCFDLKETADKYCEENFFEVSHHDEFLKLEVEEVIGLISRDSLKVAKEEEVYAAVMRWVAFDPERSKDDVSLLMEHVRLPLVQWDFLIKEVSKDKLFVTNEDCRNYLQQARAFQASSFHPDLINFAYNEAVVRSQPRAFFSAADLLYSVGGESSEREILSSFESFNPFTNQATQLPALPEAKRSLGVAVVDKIIYAVGGATSTETSRSVHAFDIDKQQWLSRGQLCVARSSVVVAVAGGGVYALGGHGEHGVLSSSEKYDIELNSWSLSEMLEPRSMAAAAVVDNRLYLCGGYDGVEDLCSCHVFDTKNHQWSVCASMNQARSMLGASALDGKVYVSGGCHQDQCLDSVECFDPNSNLWTLIQPLTGPRRGMGFSTHGDTLYIAGGHDGKTLQGSIMKYNKNTKDWAVVGNLITKRGRFGFL